MNHPIDKIFKDKLENYSVDPSADSWERFDSFHQNKRNKKYKTWLSIAASLSLLVISVYWINLETTTPARITENDFTVIEKTGMTKEPIEALQEQKKIIALNDFKKEGDDPVHTAVKAKKLPTTKDAEIDVLKSAEVTIALPEAPEKLGLKPEVVGNSKIQIADLELTIPDLPTKNVNDKATTLFDKITQTAYDIKNSDGVMAELRGLKNEVLSLEFFKNKKSI